MQGLSATLFQQPSLSIYMVTGTLFLVQVKREIWDRTLYLANGFKAFQSLILQCDIIYFFDISIAYVL